MSYGEKSYIFQYIYCLKDRFAAVEVQHITGKSEVPLLQEKIFLLLYIVEIFTLYPSQQATYGNAKVWGVGLELGISQFEGA